MKMLFYPKSLRYHLSQQQGKIIKGTGTVLILLGVICAGIAFKNSRTISKNDLLTNEKLLMLRSEAKANPQALDKYEKLNNTMSAEYILARTNQTTFVSAAMMLLLMGSLLFKIEKNLRK